MQQVNKQPLERAILFSINLSRDVSVEEQDRSLDELAALAETAGSVVVGRMSQRRNNIDPAYRMGKGKLKELKTYVENLEADLVISDDELTPTQLRNLEEELDIKVIDRTLLILDIFAQHALSHEGRLQVELAQLRYRLPRLRAVKGSLSRLGAGIGTRGPGETKLETDRRHIRRRISKIEDELETWTERRARQRQRRSDALTIAVVGYTNAGKSSLINRLCQSDLYVEDKLFATLDANLRKVYLPNVPRDVILSDTVGFIRKLPHQLIEAFRSTLEVAAEADLLLHVIDSSDPEAATRLDVSRQVLDEIGAENVPTFYALNKIDLLEENTCRDPLLMPSVRAIAEPSQIQMISVKTGEGIQSLRNALATASLEVLAQTQEVKA